MLVTDHPFLRLEFDWIALDDDDLVGFFSTAGAGPIPETTLAAASDLEDLYDRLKRLTDTGNAKLAGRFDRDVSEWLTVARKGLYAYDWRRESRTYEIVARPDQPLTISKLEDPALVAVAQRTRLQLGFPDTDHLP